jgi:hypothetical protein
MSDLTNSQLELYSKHAIDGLALGKFLRTEIAVTDKGVSFDGSIWVFKNSIEKKEDLIGSVRVQVKSNEVKRFSSSKISFSMDMADLRNYYNSEGVLLLVVQVKPNGETKVFYKSLLTLELSGIIKKYGHQGSRSISLRAMEESDLYRVCYSFWHNQKLQPRVLVENRPISMEDFTQFSVRSMTYNPHVHSYKIHDHDFDLYGFYNGTMFPLANMSIDTISTHINVKFTCEGLAFENDVKMERTEKALRFEIEGVFTLTFNNMKSYEFDFLDFNTLEKQLKAIPFITSLLSGKKVESEYGMFALDDTPNLKKRKQEYLNVCSFLERTQKTFDILGIPHNTPITSEGKEDETRLLDILNLLILDNVTEGIKQKNYRQFVNFPIGDRSVLLHYTPEGERKFCNAFSRKVAERQVIFQNESGTVPCSPYLKLNIEILPSTINFDDELVRESFDRAADHLFSAIGNPLTNNFCLACVQAYDRTKDVRMLQIAEHIYNIAIQKNQDDAVVRINRYQILRRLRSLTEREMAEIFELKMTADGNSEVLFCTNVLLGNSFEAKQALYRMDQELQRYYESLPIFHLFEQLINKG